MPTQWQALHQAIRRDEQHRASRLHQPVSYGAHSMRLAGARQTERQHVDAPLPRTFKLAHLKLFDNIQVIVAYHNHFTYLYRGAAEDIE